MLGKAKMADVIVIGGGVAGLSTALQLALRGSRVVVLERQRLGNGSTGRAAGLLGQLRGTAEHTRLLVDSVEIVRELEDRAGAQIYVQTGSLRIAQTPERAREIQDLVEMGRSIGFEIDRLPIADVARMLPYMKTDDLVEACYCPTDGHLKPSELVSAYLQIGREHGVQYQSDCPVDAVLIAGGKAKGVKTPEGELHAPVIVNAAGPWSYLIADLADSTLPTTALEHRYLTTLPHPDRPVDRLSPAVRDRHQRIYSRPEGGGLLVGMYGVEAVVREMGELPREFDMSAMTAREDDVYVAQLIEAAGKRFPWIDAKTPMTVTVGIMTFTPDGQPFCGTMPGVEGLYHCSGFSGHGIVQSPTIGRIMAELILDGKTRYDLAAIEADRYFDLPGFVDRDEITARCCHMYAEYYGRLEGKSTMTRPVR